MKSITYQASTSNCAICSTLLQQIISTNIIILTNISIFIYNINIDIFMWEWTQGDVIIIYVHWTVVPLRPSLVDSMLCDRKVFTTDALAIRLYSDSCSYKQQTTTWDYHYPVARKTTLTHKHACFYELPMDHLSFRLPLFLSFFLSFFFSFSLCCSFFIYFVTLFRSYTLLSLWFWIALRENVSMRSKG